MNEIREKYKGLKFKALFVELLSEKLMLEEKTIQCSLSKNGTFRDKHIPKVKKCLEQHLITEKIAVNIIVKEWALL